MILWDYLEVKEYLVLEKIGLEEDMPIEHKMLTKSIEGAQKKVEGRNFGIRKHVLQYDDVMNKQKIIYAERRRVLEGENLQEQVENMIHSFNRRRCYVILSRWIWCRKICRVHV